MLEMVHMSYMAQRVDRTDGGGRLVLSYT